MSPEVRQTVDRLTAFTGLDQATVRRSRTGAAPSWSEDRPCRAALGRRARRAERTAGHSGCPAHVRIPTRARSLYGKRVLNRDDLDKAVISDRPLDMAVSAFAPGALVVRDGWLHVAVGFADYEIKGRTAKPGTRSGQPYRWGPARHAKERSSGRKMTCVRPVMPRSGCSTSTSHAASARRISPATTTTRMTTRPAQVCRAGRRRAAPEYRAGRCRKPGDFEQAQVVQINDNHGDLYEFVQLGDRSVTVDSSSLFLA